MKKRVAILLLVVLLFSLVPLISASETDQVNSAYSYLMNQADGKWKTLDSETASLALLALSYDDRVSSDGKTELFAKSFQNRCWPTSSCKIKDTSLAILALGRLGENVDEPLDWLDSQQKPFQVSGISWYLQIDSQEPSNCTVSYETSRTINDHVSINKDRTYSMGSSSCLELSGDKYWIRIKPSCLDKSFAVSCDNTAAVSLPYKLGSTLYVQSQTSNSPTEVSISTICLKEGASCTYEGTLWAAYALMKSGKEFSQLMPYLISEAENNKKYLPDALLFLLTTSDAHAQNLLSLQSKDGYWTDVGGYGRYWDTALAHLSISEYAPDNATKAKSWLLKNQNQDFSWGTYKTKDTAFILFSVWPKAVSASVGECVSRYGYFCRTSCEYGEDQVSYSCISGVCCKPQAGECSTVADCLKSQCLGEVVTDSIGKKGICENPESSCSDGFDNDDNGLTDSSDPECQKSCYDWAGTECSSDEVCDGDLRKAIETDRCCVGSCTKETRTCSSQGGVFCSSDKCSGTSVSSSDSTSTQICCAGKCKSGLSVTAWILIIILILIVIAGTFYLYKKGYLKKYIDYLKNLKWFKKKPSAPSNQQMAFQPPVRAYSPMITHRQIERKIPTVVERELDETMGKIKKFSEK